jgi:DNA-binding NarL/FixJ family response regulator
MANQAGIRVVVVDKDPEVRASLAFSLASATDTLTIVGEAGSVTEALPLIATVRPQVVLMDMGLPERDGLAGTRQLRQRFPQLRVVVLTSSHSERYRQLALGAGAAACVSKYSPRQYLASLIRALATR